METKDVTGIIPLAASPDILARAMDWRRSILQSPVLTGLWQWVYLDPSHKVYVEFPHLPGVETGSQTAKRVFLSNSTGRESHHPRLQLSSCRTNLERTEALMDTHSATTRGQAPTIFDETNVDSEFLGSRVDLPLLRIMFSEPRCSTGTGR
ncbi:hypothetical protein GBAR_LOCUS25390 [Geodia barretti]|uniref:Uncharacterized protein n=1 Tax=Geodia barretti TaxID=519541 RepID=A0AA35XC20_GEOBA|nr:hypothetical protein GBAR_LOCUS25390 [Geodia barretti]